MNRIKLRGMEKKVSMFCICVAEAGLLSLDVLFATKARVCAVSQDDTFAVSVIHALSAELHRSESHKHKLELN